LIAVAEPAIERMDPVEHTFKIRNVDRVVGTMMSGTIAKRHGGAGLPEGTIRFTFQGSAGQSFGAWLTKGTTFRLEGDANDGFAKGLSGGRVIVVPPDGATYAPEDNVIIGNVALYGASRGEAYIRGVGGERFAVRNSNASAVIEGIGDHGCEYMTGGRVVVLGPTGRNFGAGMSGGVAYIWDADDTFANRFNSAMADIEPVLADSLDEKNLRDMIECHLEYTGSDVARRILDNWPASRERFKKVMPKAYAAVLRESLAAVVESV
jgi:glutamate synthase domain-containing protein 3